VTASSPQPLSLSTTKGHLIAEANTDRLRAWKQTKSSTLESDTRSRLLKYVREVENPLYWASMSSLPVFLLAFQFCLVVTILLPRQIHGDRIRAENGEISLVIAVPLTAHNGTVTKYSGWMHMAAMVMAVDHFNERNGIILPKLMSDHGDKCGGLQFTNVSVVDTGTDSHLAMKSILQFAMEHNHGYPDAIVGPYDEIPTYELSVMATALDAPFMALRGFDNNLVSPARHPFYNQINPDLQGQMQFVGEYLKFRGRTNYIAILHTSEVSVLQIVEILHRILQQDFGINQTKSFSYLAANVEADDRGIREAVHKVAQTGYRTILVITGTPDTDTPEMGQAAHDLELDRGDHFWILSGGLDASSVDKDAILLEHQNTTIGGFIRGASFLNLFDGIHLDENSTFQTTFSNLNASFVQRLRELNPLPNFFVEDFFDIDYTDYPRDEPFPPDDIFQRLPHMMEYISFAYDSVMAIGAGACHAIQLQQQQQQQEQTNGTTTTISTAMTGEEHLKGIRSVDFQGLSGQVKFGEQLSSPGSRVGASVYHGVLNLLPPNGKER